MTFFINYDFFKNDILLYYKIFRKKAIKKKKFKEKILEFSEYLIKYGTF